MDASITARWARLDEIDPSADVAFDFIRTEEAIVPSLWWFEVRNILVVNERRKRITEPETASFLFQLSRMRIRIDIKPADSAILRLSQSHGLSVYDAAYLELAQREGLAIATLGKDLRTAATFEGVTVV